MYRFKEFVKKYNIDKQIPDAHIYAANTFLTIETTDYRICVYGWPDNRVSTENLITGVNKIRRFGHNGKDKCERYLKSCLSAMGVDFFDGNFNIEDFESDKAGED